MMVHHISPWNSDKNIGLANNQAIALLPKDDWVCLTDGDAAWMIPNWGELIEQVVAANGDAFDLIGCSTNRLGGPAQLYGGVFDSVCNAYDCYDDAKEAWEKYGTAVVPTDKIAGLCMIFRVSTWEKVGGFVENSRMADVQFCKAVKRTGGKIGIAKGLYMMHNYRLWETEMKKAKANFKHLVK